MSLADAASLTAAITGLIAAVGATVAAVAAVRLLFYAQQQTGEMGRQVQQMAKQEQEMLETRRAQYLPLVIPARDPPLQKTTEGEEYFSPDQPPENLLFRNIGPGPALNVWTIIFGPPLQYHAHTTAPRRATVLTVPLGAGAEAEAARRDVGTLAVRGTTSIDGTPEHILYAPPAPTFAETMLRDIGPVLARYTITYHDIFGIKHASQFDFTGRHRWRCVGFYRVDKDLEELHREQYAANMAGVASNGSAQSDELS